ncbi:MAG: hypothetical protein JNN28_17530 [Saprospiraceae bacterium]|nr:hypothetical protein [Saprospiraceae bacterium]
MDHNFKLTDEILWDYADGFLPAEERIQVESWLRQHPESQVRLDHILVEKRAFASAPMEKPDSGFAQQVMNAWAQEHAPVKSTVAKKTLDWIFWAAGSILIFMVFVPFLLAPDAPATKPMQIPEKFVPQISVPAYDWAGLLNSHMTYFLILAILAFLSLKLLDKYLQVRKLQTAE